MKLLFISVVLTISSGICTFSYPLLKRSVQDTAIVFAGRPDKPPAFDEYRKRRKNESPQNNIEAVTPSQGKQRVTRPFVLKKNYDTIKNNHRRLMALHRDEVGRWFDVKNRWPMSVVLGFLGLSGLVLSLVLMGFAVLAVRSKKFPILRARS